MAVRLRLLPDGIAIDTGDDRALIDLVDEHDGLSIPLGCRSTHCGSCLVRVAEGAGLIAPADDWERQVLARITREPTARLGCAVVITADAGELVLERLAPD